MNLCVYTCFVYLQPFCVTLDFKLFIDSIHILFLLYLLLWFWDFLIKNLQDFIKISRALIKDTLLDKSFKPLFVFIDYQPDLVCKIASIEPDSGMYLLCVSTDSLPDWVTRVQTQLNHVLTQGLKLDESGDWDQQANWAKRGIPLWVHDEKLGSEALSLKEKETVQKGQAAEAQAPAKRKSTGGEPAPKKKKTASKPQAAKSVTGEESDESDGDEEEESEEEEEEEPQVSQGKAAKKAASKPRPEETGAKAPFKQPAGQSQPRDQPAKPPPKGKTSVAKSMGSKMQVVPKKK